MITLNLGGGFFFIGKFQNGRHPFSSKTKISISQQLMGQF